MRGGVGVRVGGGVAMLLEERGEGGGEECLRQPRIRESRVVVEEYSMVC